MKFTPGPWSVGVYDATEKFRSIEQHSCVCDPETMALIAVTGPADDRQSQIDADLIAAAPDLLAACEAVLYNARFSFPVGTNKVKEQLVAAINKARGGS